VQVSRRGEAAPPDVPPEGASGMVANSDISLRLIEKFLATILD
jgi:hypothetical protein